MATPIKIDYVANWTARLRGRLFTQFRNKVTWEQWVRLFGGLAQDLEDAVQSVLILYDIDNSAGALLDEIGNIVGQPRFGATDEAYRTYLKAKVLVNRSSGAAEQIYTIWRTLVGSPLTIESGYIVGFPLGVKVFVLRVGPRVTSTLATVMRFLLHSAKETGARAILEWQEGESADMFTFQVGSLLAAASLAGATSLQVYDTSGFIAGASLRIDAGTATEEKVAAGGFTVTGPNSISVPALTFAHGAGAAVEVLEATGKGFGNALDDSIGGLFELASLA